jgi:hypothetical protein
MTNKMKLIFAAAAAASLALSVLMSMGFAIDIADQVLSAIANVLSLHEAHTLSALVILVITGLYLYFAFSQRRHP